MEWLKQTLEYIQDGLVQNEKERPHSLDVVKGRLGHDSSFDKRVDQTNQKDRGFLDEHKISITTENSPVPFKPSKIEASTSVKSKNAGKALLDCDDFEDQKRQIQGKDQNRQGDLKIWHKDPQSTLLFSDNEAEKSIANEIAITRAYYDIWQKKGMQGPDASKFNKNCAKADSVFDVDLKACSSNRHAEILKNIRQVNVYFRKIAEKNPEQFRSALKDVITRARTLDDWVKNFTTRFDLNEDWVKAGMRQLGISQENFDESYSKFLANPHITEKTFGRQAVSDIIDRYQPDKIVQHYEGFMRANTSLGYINDQLKAGVPVSGIPKNILGREVIQVSGDKNDCLPRALLKGAYPEWTTQVLEDCVCEVRNYVVGKLEEKEKEQSILDIENLGVKCDHQLNFGGDAGQILTECLRSHFFDPERPIFAYQYADGKIQCFEQTAGSSGERPYAVLRESYSETSGHYWAIKDE